MADLTADEVIDIIDEMRSTRLPIVVSLVNEPEQTVSDLARKVAKSISWVQRQTAEMEEQGLLRSGVPFHSARGRVYSLTVDPAIIKDLPGYEPTMKSLKAEADIASRSAMRVNFAESPAAGPSQTQDTPKKALTKMRIGASGPKGEVHLVGFIPASFSYSTMGDEVNFEVVDFLGRAVIVPHDIFVDKMQELSQKGFLTPGPPSLSR